MVNSVLGKNQIQLAELKFAKINQQLLLLMLNVKALLTIVLQLELVVSLFQYVHHTRLNLYV